MRVHGVGPTPCRVAIIGEGPGAREVATGIPFHPHAPAGAELTRYLNGISLPLREDCYISNLIKEWEGGAATKKQDVTPADIARDEHELKLELSSVHPEIVVALGRHSARWLLNADVDMDATNGLLFDVHYCEQCGHRRSRLSPGGLFGSFCLCPASSSVRFFCVPVYHPAAGLHQPELAARTAYGFSILSALLKQPWQHWTPWTPAPLGTYVGHTPEYPYDMPSALEQAIDTEGTPEAPWGLSLAVKPGEAAVARFADWDALNEKLFEPFNLPLTWIIFHNYLWDRKVLRAKGIEVHEDRFHDTMLMAYLLQVEPQGLKALALRHLGRVRKSYEEVVGEWVEVLGKSGKPLKKKKLVLKSLDDIAVKDATDYAGADADDTLSVKPILWQRVKDLGLEQVYEIDRRVLPLYSRMEEVGLPIDLDYFKSLQQNLEEELQARTEILQGCLSAGPYQEAYANFNPGSADQVASLLFNRLHLPGWKKTPSGKRFTTNDKILQALCDIDETGLVQAIVDWREVQKLLTTFVAPIEQYCQKVGDEWRLFFQILPTRVVSGRVAYKHPNVGAFPKYGRGQAIRQGFRAGPGRKLGSFDLNQIELRVLALDSGSSFLQEAFRSGLDLHAATGLKIFGASAHDGPRRVASKAVNFSIPMGTTKFGLAEQMRRNHYPFPELKGQWFETRKARMEAEAEVCDQWIKGVIELWGIEPYLSEMRSMARRYGYVSDRWGRKRFLPSVLSPNKQIREEALRQAQAFGPQAGARGFMKTIECRVWREVIAQLRREGYYIEPLLDLHDDLTCEFQEDLADYFLGVVGAIFNETFTEAIPITAKGAVGQTWADL